MSSEDEKKSTVEIPRAASVALVCMEPATLMERWEEPQDSVRWRLSVEVAIELVPGDRPEPETYSASLATVVLPPVEHARQVVAIWYWPIGATSLTGGRVTGLTFRWEADRVRASADVMILVADPSAGPQTGMCGLFALPFPGETDLLRGGGR